MIYLISLKFCLIHLSNPHKIKQRMTPIFTILTEEATWELSISHKPSEPGNLSVELGLPLKIIFPFSFLEN